MSDVFPLHVLDQSHCRIPESPISQGVKWILVCSWAWSDITQITQSSSKIINQDYIKKKISSTFLYILDSTNGGSYEITVACPSVTDSVGQLNISCRSY